MSQAVNNDDQQIPTLNIHHQLIIAEGTTLSGPVHIHIAGANNIFILLEGDTLQNCTLTTDNNGDIVVNYENSNIDQTEISSNFDFNEESDLLLGSYYDSSDDEF